MTRTTASPARPLPRAGCAAVFAIALVGCQPPAPSHGVTASAPCSADYAVAQQIVSVSAVPGSEGPLCGVSDLALDDGGQLWAVAERQRVLVPLDLDGGRLRGPVVRLEGVPPDADTEAMAWLGPDRVAFGTESHSARDGDRILLARLEGGVARVLDTLLLRYAPWGITAPSNRGIEGLAYAAPDLLAAAEATLEGPDGRRAAPIGRYDTETRRWSSYSVVLTSKTGLLSAIACRRSPSHDGAVDCLAIERYYGEARVIRFLLPRTREDAPHPLVVEASCHFDLARHLPPDTNPEGLARRPDGRLLVISDNDSGGVSGPTRLFELTPR